MASRITKTTSSSSSIGTRSASPKQRSSGSGGALHPYSSSSTSIPPLIVLVGDSDIDCWPSSLYPSFTGNEVYIKSGHPGATLAEIVPHLKSTLKKTFQQAEQQQNETNSSINGNSSLGRHGKVVIVMTGGENDIPQGVGLRDSARALRSILKTIAHHYSNVNDNISLIFLGPKIEPWMKDDKDTIRQYTEMSACFERMCELHEKSSILSFVNCLYMFCDDTANDEPVDSYFDSNDKLHLSESGYKMWQEVIEARLRLILM